MKLKSGDAGYRSRYLSHAKRALYHLSYTPLSMGHAPHSHSKLFLNTPPMKQRVGTEYVAREKKSFNIIVTLKTLETTCIR